MKTSSRYKKPAKTNRAPRGNVYEAPTFTAKLCNVVGKTTTLVLIDASKLPHCQWAKIEISARTSRGGHKKRNKQEH